MGLFSPYQRKDSTSQVSEPVSAPDSPAKGPAKKTIPTPTRKAAEQARRDRVHPQVTPKEAKARDRVATREARIQQMDQADKTPARSLARDYVDSRWSVGEWLMPMLLVTVVVALVAQQALGAATAASLMSVALILSYGTLAATALEIFLHWNRFKKLLRARLPRETSKGLLFYFSNRWISIRGLRQPKPLYKRGADLS